MPLLKWFRSIRNIQRSVERRTRPSGRSFSRICIEELESRDVPTTLTLGLVSSPVNEGQSTTLNGSIGDPPADPFAVLINWGDGQKQTVNLNGGATSFSTNHLFVDDNPTGTPSDTHAITGDLYTIDGTQVTFGTAVRMGGIGEDYASSIALDSSGNIYTTGYFEGTVDFDPGPDTYNLATTGLFDFDVFVTKFDPAGNFIWARSFGGESDDTPMGIAVDAAGNLAIVGNFLDVADFDPGPGTFDLASAGDLDAFVVKLSSDGNFIWAKSFGGLEADSANAVAFGPSGSIHIVGGFADTVDFDPGAGTVELTSAGNADVFVVKLSTNGSLVWAANMGGTFTDTGSAIAVDATGNVFITGSFGDNADFDPGAGEQLLTVSGDNDAFLCKLTSAGTLSWAFGMGGVDFDFGTGVALDADGNVYTIGNFGGDVDFDPSGTNAILSSVGSVDAYIAKYTGAGAFVWAGSVGGADYDSGNAIALDVYGNVYVTGAFASTADFDPGAATANLTAVGSNIDVFTLKLTNAGTFVWVQQQGGTDSETGNAIAVNGLSDVYVAGGFGGTADFDPTAGTFNLISDSGSTDAFVSRLRQSTFATNASTNVTVSNVAPTVLAGPDGFIQPGGTFTQSGSFTDPGTDTFTATVNYGDGSGTQALTLNPDRTYNLNHTYATVGLYTVTVTVTDDDTGVSNDTVRVFVGTPPAFESMQINDGTAQRSRVTQLTVTFNTIVNPTELNTAFTLRRQHDNVTVGTVSVASSVVGGKTVAVLTFSGTNTDFTSLADGRWKLEINAEQVIGDSTGLPMAANYLSVEFHRRFGDSDGDRDVDSLDFIRFRNAIGSNSSQAAYRAYFDSEGDGDIDSLDFIRFRQRLGVLLP
jgi:hypothetical protein